MQPWLKARFSAPYLRDDLLTQGVMVETLETATQWSNVGRLHRDVGRAIAEALEGCGTPGLVMCHISHVYPAGASLYFTFISRALLGGEDLPPHDAGVGHPTHDGDGDVDAPLAGPEGEDQSDDQHVEGEGHHDVDKAHHTDVDPASVVAGQAAEGRAEDEGEDDGEKRNAQVGPGAVEQLRPYIDAELVRAQQVLR